MKPELTPHSALRLNGGDASSPIEKAASSLQILLILSALMSFASISTDLYLPAIPAMGADLHADTGHVELTISGYLVGFSLGQLWWGPFGDRFGRRLPIGLGLILFIIGSAGCALATSVDMMIGWRALQALGACASVVQSRAMVRDLHTGQQAARMMSTLMTVMAVAPLVGPFAGGLILHLASWRAIFWTQLGIGIATLYALHRLPETLPPERRSQTSISEALLDYGALLRQRRLLGYLGVGGCFYGGMFAYIAGTPFAYITYYDVSPQHYGFLFGLGIVGIMLSNQINIRLLFRFGVVRLMRAGVIGAALAGGLLASNAHSGWGGLAGLVIPLFMFVAMTGFIVANSIAGALAANPERAGAVSALVGMSQYGTGILGSALVGYWADGTPWPMGCVIAIFGAGGLLCAYLLVTGKK